MPHPITRLSLLATVSLLASNPAGADTLSFFTPGDLVISTVSNQTVSGQLAYTANNSKGGGLDTASPITLTQFSLGSGGSSASSTGSFTLRQTTSGTQSAISGEYGSASEGILQLSANGQYLTITGYGVNADTFNTAINNSTATGTYGATALGQTTSLTGQSVATVARVVALIDANTLTDTSTALTGVFNTNNPRSAATVDGSSFYVTGQGSGADTTGGVFYATKGATTATAINASSASGVDGTVSADPTYGTEARVAEIVNTGSGNQLIVSRDVKASGTPNDTTDLRKLTDGSGNLPTSATGLQATRLTNTNTSSGEGGNSRGANTSSINLGATTSSTVSTLGNNVNVSRDGKFVYLSPEQFFFANATTLYIADSGSPKNGSAGSAQLGEGGLQKWSLIGGVWTLEYDIYAFNVDSSGGINNGNTLSFVDNSTASKTPTKPGITGLFGLTGQVEADGTVELFATTYGLNELSPSYLVEVTDTLSSTTLGSSENFNVLYDAPIGTNIRGVSFAPVPEPASMALFGVGAVAMGVVRRRRRK